MHQVRSSCSYSMEAKEKPSLAHIDDIDSLPSAPRKCCTPPEAPTHKVRKVSRTLSTCSIGFLSRTVHFQHYHGRNSSRVTFQVGRDEKKGDCDSPSTERSALQAGSSAQDNRDSVSRSADSKPEQSEGKEWPSVRFMAQLGDELSSFLFKMLHLMLNSFESSRQGYSC